jgi:dTDP-glucose pyrophosphorylase
MSIALKKMYDSDRYGNVIMDNKNKIINFEEKSFKKE